MTLEAVIDSIEQLWRHVGLDESFVRPNLFLSGDPNSAVPSSFKVGHLAQATVALCGLAASLFHGRRNDSQPPRVKVDARHAMLNFCKRSYRRLVRGSLIAEISVTEAYTLIDGKVPPDVWDALTGLYATQDGHVRIHTIFPQ